MVSRWCTNAWSPLRSVSRPPSAIAANAIAATGIDRSLTPAITSTSEPTASNPEATTIAMVLFESECDEIVVVEVGMSCFGRIPAARIATSRGSVVASECRTVTCRATRSNSSERTPSTGKSTSRSSFSSVAQSSSSTRNVVERAVPIGEFTARLPSALLCLSTASSVRNPLSDPRNACTEKHGIH